jgi:subtilisin family serine protease
MYLFLAFLALVPASSAGRIPILLPNRGMSNNTTILYSSSKSVTDTIMPTLASPFSGYDATYRVEYEATKLTPASPCTVIAVMHGVTADAASSKQCSVYVWSDASGNPGTKLFGTGYTASFTTGEYNWNYVPLPSPVYVTGPFWVGNREWTAADPTTALDQTFTTSCPTKYDYGSGWTNDQYDYCHAAVVRYASTGTPSINVTPSYVVFQIDSNPPKSFAAPTFIPPVMTENDPEYWENIVPGELLIGYKNSVDTKKASLTELGLTQKEVTSVNRDIGSNIIYIKTTANLEQEKALLTSLKSHSNISFVEPNRTGVLEAIPSDPLFTTYQWDKVRMNATTAWDYGYGSTSISIGIIDCGIDYTHEDLIDRFTTTKGYDFMSGDNDPAPGTSEQHGTACAGIAAATINNAKGIAGVANARLYALRASTSTTPDVAKVAQSIQWCIDNGVKIISMSLSFSASDATLQTKCDAAWAAGIILFAASGNNGAETTRYPAAYSSVIAVGSIDTFNTRSSFSNYGSYLDIVAPGGTHGGGAVTQDIACPIPGNQYTTGWGTSFATPNTAGAAALIWSLKSSLTNQQLKDLMQNTATDLGTAGWDKEYGYGEVNIAAALAGGMVAPDTGIINVQNLGSATADLDVSNITYKSTWVQSVSPKTFSVSVGNSQAVSIIVQGSLHTGYYYDTLSIVSNDAQNPYKVPLILKVGDVGVAESEACIQRFNLKVSPNPTSDFLNIKFNIPATSNVTLKIYNASGRVVKTAMNNTKLSGDYNAKINTSDLCSGVYFVSLKAGDTRISKKVTLIQ